MDSWFGSSLWDVVDCHRIPLQSVDVHIVCLEAFWTFLKATRRST